MQSELPHWQISLVIGPRLFPLMDLLREFFAAKLNRKSGCVATAVRCGVCAIPPRGTETFSIHRRISWDGQSGRIDTLDSEAVHDRSSRAGEVE